MNFVIKTNTQVEKRAAIILIHKMLGCELGPEYKDASSSIKPASRMDMSFPYVGLSRSGGHVEGFSAINVDRLSLTYLDYATELPEIIARLTPELKIYKVPNVGQHTAAIDSCGVRVGNAEISFPKLKEIVAKVEEFHSDHR